MNDEADEWTREDSERLAGDIGTITVLTRRLDMDDLRRARREIDKYEAAGPVLDPTDYRENREATQRTKERLDALIEFRDALGPSGDEITEVLSDL